MIMSKLHSLIKQAIKFQLKRVGIGKYTIKSQKLKNYEREMKRIFEANFHWKLCLIEWFGSEVESIVQIGFDNLKFTVLRLITYFFDKKL